MPAAEVRLRTGSVTGIKGGWEPQGPLVTYFLTLYIEQQSRENETLTDLENEKKTLLDNLMG